MNGTRPGRPGAAILELRLSGAIDEQSVHALLCDPVHTGPTGASRWLVHTCTAQVRFDARGLTALAERLAGTCTPGRQVRVHVVATDELNYGCMRMLAAWLDRSMVQVRVYSDAETARGELLAA